MIRISFNTRSSAYLAKGVDLAYSLNETLLFCARTTSEGVVLYVIS